MRSMLICEAIKCVTGCEGEYFLRNGVELFYKFSEGEKIELTQEEIVLIGAKIIELESEQSLKNLRKIRNNLLKETDWWELPSQSITQNQLEYRQSLRDITNNFTSLEDVIWPIKP